MHNIPRANLQGQRSAAFAAFCSATCPRKAVTWALLWSSLPTASKLLVVFLVGQAGLWLGYTAGNGARIATACMSGTAGAKCTAEQWQAKASTLAAQLSLTYLTLDAIHEENAFQMLASTVYSVLSGLMWVMFVAVLGPMMLGWRFALVCSFIAATAINAWLAYTTYQQFGWRIHSRLACDYRRKHASEKQQLYFLVSRFKTLLRFSWHAILVNVVNYTVLALTAHSSANAATAPVAPAAEQQMITVPIAVANAAPLLMQYSHVAAPLADAVNNNSISLQHNSTSVYDSVEAAVAAAARAAVAGVQSVGAATLPVQGAAASIHSNSSSNAVTGLLASLTIWLLPAAWLLVTYMAVERNSNRLQQLSSAALPILMLLPALPLYWVFNPMYFWPERIVVRVLLLACPMAVWLGLALAVWLTMATLMKQFRLPIVQELLAAAVDDSNENAYQQDLPEQLQPLLRGAWLLKPLHTLDAASCSSTLPAKVAGSSVSSSRFDIQRPGAARAEAAHPTALTSDSQGCRWLIQLGLQLCNCCHAVATTILCSSKRWRFFQLSSDLTTLRWAWNKYILLYYVDSITTDADRLTITLHMVLDPDLTLAFADSKTYDRWESALQLLLHMLMGAAPGSGLRSATGTIATNLGFSIQARHVTAGHNEGIEDVLGTKQWTAPAAARAQSFSQHSLVLTALNVQYGLEGPAGGVTLCGSTSAGLGRKVKRRNSFLQSSRRHSVGDPEARKLRQAQSMVELMSQQLSNTSVSFSAAQQSSSSLFQQQEDWQQQQEEWQQQRRKPLLPPPAAATTCCQTDCAAALAAMRAASQVLLLPHQLAGHQQQQPQCALGTAAASAAVNSPGPGPFRTPVGLLQHLQQQQLSSWQDPDSSSGGGAATLSTSYIQSGTSGSHASPMHSGSFSISALSSQAKQYSESIHCCGNGSVNLAARVGGAAGGSPSRMQPQQLQQQPQHGDMHNSERCSERQSSSSCEHQNGSGVGRSGYISPCISPEPWSMVCKASLLAAQQGVPKQTLHQQPPRNERPGSVPIQQGNQPQHQQMSPVYRAGKVPADGAGLRALSPNQLLLQVSQPKMLRSHSMPASLEALSRDMQQAVVAVVAEAGSLVADKQRLSRTALGVSSCSALSAMLQGIATGKPGGIGAGGKDAQGIGAFMPPLPENAGSGIRAVWGSEGAESAANSVQASTGGSLGVLSSTAGGGQDEPSYPESTGWGQVVVSPGPDKCTTPGYQPGSQKPADNSTTGCELAVVRPGGSSRPDGSTLGSAESQVHNTPGTRPVVHAGDIAIAIERAGLAVSCSAQQAEVSGMPAVVPTSTGGSIGTWKASLQAFVASISSAVAHRVAGTASDSIPHHQMHKQPQQRKPCTACIHPGLASSTRQHSPFSNAAAAAAAASEGFHSTGVTATAPQVAPPLSGTRHIDSSNWHSVVTDQSAQPCNSHGSFSTMGWSAASRSNTPWSNVGSLDTLQSPGGSGPALAAAAATATSGQMKASTCRTSSQSPTLQEAYSAGSDLSTAATAVTAPVPVPAAVHCTAPKAQATGSHTAPHAHLLPKQTPPVSLPVAAAAESGFASREVAAQVVAAAGQQLPPVSILPAPAEQRYPRSHGQLGISEPVQGTRTNHAAVPIDGTPSSALREAPVEDIAMDFSRGSSIVTPVSQQHGQPPRLAYGLPSGAELRRLGSVSFNSMPQLPVLPEAPASAELDSNEYSNEEGTTRAGSSGSDNDNSAIGDNTLLQQQPAFATGQAGRTQLKQQSPFMTASFVAGEQQHLPQQQQPFTLQAAYQFATSGASRDNLPPSPRSPKSPRAAWLRQQQLLQIQQLGMHLSDGASHSLGSQGSGGLRLQGSGHLRNQGSGKLGAQVSGHFGAHGSGWLAAQGSGHLGAQGTGRLVPQGSGRLAAQGSWGLRAQGSMHLNTQGQNGVQGLDQAAPADLIESPRGLKLSVKIPDTRRPSAQGQLLLHVHGGSSARTLPYQGTWGYNQHHLPNGALAQEDFTSGAAATTPDGLASCPSHASMITDWNVGSLNSPLTARTNTFSVASGGYWGSMQLASSSGSFDAWSAFTVGSGHSKASSFRTGMAPQVPIEVIDWHCLQLGKRIGRGAEGSVYEARLQDAPVAVKEGPGMQEIEMYLAAGIHDNIVGLRGLCHRDDGTWCLVLEWCRGTLDTLLHHSSSPLPRAYHPLRSNSNGGSSSSSDGGRGNPTSAAVKAAHSAASFPRHLPGSAATTTAATKHAAAATGVAAASGLLSRPDLVKVLPLMRSIARGLLHLHSRRPAILHRDIKPANIFVGHGMVMKIGDFGMSRHVFPTPTDTAAAGTRSSWGSATVAARQGSSNGGGGLRSSMAGTRGRRGSSAGASSSSTRQAASAAVLGALAPAPSPAGLGGSDVQPHQQNQTQVQPQQHQEQLLPVACVRCSSAASAVPVRTLTPGVVGTIAYSAPEVLDEQLQQPNPTVERILKADVYSLGVTMWEMLERRRPLEGLDGMQICAMWIADPQQMVLPPLTVANNASDHEQKVLAALQDLVRECTAFNPDARPTMKQVLERIRQAQRLCDPKTAATVTAAAAGGGGGGGAAAAAGVPNGAMAAAAAQRTAGLVVDSAASCNTAPGSSSRTEPTANAEGGSGNEGALGTTPNSTRLVPAAAAAAGQSSIADEPASFGVLHAGGMRDPTVGTAMAAFSAVSIAKETITSCKDVSGGAGPPSCASVGEALLVASGDGPCTDSPPQSAAVNGSSLQVRHHRASSDTDVQGVALRPLEGLQDPLWHSSSLPTRLSVGRDRSVSGQGLMQRHVH